MSPPRPSVLCNPVDDIVFQRVVESLLVGASSAEDLQVALRSSYPRALVRPRELSSEPVTVWYAYRDGRWTPRGTRREGDDDGPSG